MIVIIDIASSLKMEHISTSGRGGSFNIGAITTHHTCVGEGNDAGSINDANNFDNLIVLSSSSSYWGQTTNRTKEEIFQRHMVCVKSKRDPGGSREGSIHHTNATKALSHNFGAAKHFVPKNSERESKSTKCTNIQYD